MKFNGLRLLSKIIMVIGAFVFFNFLSRGGPNSIYSNVSLMGLGIFCMGWIGFIVDEILNRLKM